MGWDGMLDPCTASAVIPNQDRGVTRVFLLLSHPHLSSIYPETPGCPYCMLAGIRPCRAEAERVGLISEGSPVVAGSNSKAVLYQSHL